MPSVVITGTSTGIGRAAALRLDREGFRVFACVRRESDAESLRGEASRQLSTLLLDVTDLAAIDQAAKSVESELGESGLDGLVNNAGIGIGGPLEYVELDEIRRQFEVNLIGPIAVIQAFLPLLRTGRGRIVNVSSGAGKVSQPLVGPYCASKFALEAVSDSLRVELRKQGMNVSVIEPGFVETPMQDKAQAAGSERLEALPPAGRERYGDALMKLQEVFARFRKRASSPEKVAEAIQRALTAPKPKPRYPVGMDARLALKMARFLPDRARDSLHGRLLGM